MISRFCVENFNLQKKKINWDPFQRNSSNYSKNKIFENGRLLQCFFKTIHDSPNILGYTLRGGSINFMF